MQVWRHFPFCNQEQLYKEKNGEGALGRRKNHTHSDEEITRSMKIMKKYREEKMKHKMINYVVRSKTYVHRKIWGNFITYLENITILSHMSSYFHILHTSVFSHFVFTHY